YGGGWATSFQDAACAIGVARATAPGYGGQAGNVTVVGHSLGGWAAAVIGLTPAAFTPRGGACDRTAGSLRPDAVVDMDGATDEPVDMEDGVPYVTAFFGGTPAQQPAAYAAADALQNIRRYPGGDDPIPLLLVHGTTDTVVLPAVSSGLHTALEAAGYPNRLLWVSGGHSAALTSGAVISAIVALAR
ncbi:MAG TPA: alpha/beta fold hydrolase, partial [Candidatus Limnocylindrales bacterium]